jgi:hypothetical protein
MDNMMQEIVHAIKMKLKQIMHKTNNYKCHQVANETPSKEINQDHKK